MSSRNSSSFFARARRRLSLLAVATMAIGLVPAFAGTAHAATSVSYTIQTRAPVSLSGSAYKMTVMAFKSSFGAQLFVTFTKRATTGNHPTQTHQFSFNLSADSIQVDGTDLVPTSINTGTQMGKFGKVDMDLKNPGTMSSRQLKCTDGTVLGSVKSRPGTWTGNFTFNANDEPTSRPAAAAIGQIHKTTLPVRVTKVSTNGKSCTGGPPRVCSTGLDFSADQFSKPLAVDASRPLSGGTTNMTLRYFETDDPASIEHSISGTGLPNSSFQISGTQAVTINAGALAPFASGTIHFTKTGSGSNTIENCKTTFFQEEYDSGSVTAKFDSGGQKTMNGADFATLSKTVKV